MNIDSVDINSITKCIHSIINTDTHFLINLNIFGIGLNLAHSKWFNILI